MRDQAAGSLGRVRAGATRGSQELLAACQDDLRLATNRCSFQPSPFKKLDSMKVYWNHMHTTAKVNILISEYTDFGKLDVIEHWVQTRQILDLEQELAKRGVAWDRDCDISGSEHLYIDSAIVHVNTHFRAGKVRLGVLRLLSVKYAAHIDANAEERASIRVASCVFSILDMTSFVLIWTGPV
jgi:hypothetical protein